MAKEHYDAVAFDEAVAQWDRRLAEAGDDLDAFAPSPRVWERVSARLDQLDADRDTVTIRANHGTWEFLTPGVYRKRLHIDAAAGWQAILLKMEPHATVPAHGHAILEECLVLEGEFEVGDEVVRKGDLHLGFPGREHREIVTHTGALLYLRTALDD